MLNGNSMSFGKRFGWLAAILLAGAGCAAQVGGPEGSVGEDQAALAAPRADGPGRARQPASGRAGPRRRPPEARRHPRRRRSRRQRDRRQTPASRSPIRRHGGSSADEGDDREPQPDPWLGRTGMDDGDGEEPQPNPWNPVTMPGATPADTGSRLCRIVARNTPSPWRISDLEQRSFARSSRSRSRWACSSAGRRAVHWLFAAFATDVAFWYLTQSLYGLFQAPIWVRATGVLTVLLPQFAVHLFHAIVPIEGQACFRARLPRVAAFLGVPMLALELSPYGRRRAVARRSLYFYVFGLLSAGLVSLALRARLTSSSRAVARSRPLPRLGRRARDDVHAGRLPLVSRRRAAADRRRALDRVHLRARRVAHAPSPGRRLRARGAPARLDGALVLARRRLLRLRRARRPRSTRCT